MKTVIAFIQQLIGAVPRIVELVKQGREPGGIKLGEVISTDALDTLRDAQDEAADYLKNG